MDPITAIGVASAVVQFVEFGLKLTKSLNEHLNARPGDIPRSLQSISTTLPLLLSILKRIKDSSESGKYDDDTYVILNGVVMGCFKLAKELEKIVDRARAKSGEKMAEKLTKVVGGMKNEERIAQINRGLEAYIQILILHQVVDRPEIPVSSSVETDYFEVKEKQAEDLVKRDHLIKRLDECFHDTVRGQKETPQWVILQGGKGVGKTQLALQYCKLAHKLGQFRAVFWLDASAPEFLKRSLENASASIRKTKAGSRQEKLYYFNEFLSQRWYPWLLVLDHYDHTSYSDEDIASILPRDGHGAILMTTRSSEFPDFGILVEVHKYLLTSEVKDLQSLVTIAIAKKDLIGVENALARGLDVDSFAKYADGSQSLVNFAAQQGFDDGVMLLLKHGANPCLKKGYGSVFTQAAYANQTSIMKLYLDFEDETGQLQEQDSYYSEVGTSIIYGNVDAIKLLLERRAKDIEPDSRHIWNNISRAAGEGHVEVIRLLHSMGKLPEAEKIRVDMLVEAINNAKLEMIEYLVNDLHVNVRGWGLSGEPVLFRALQVRDEKLRREVVSLLVKAGASPDDKRRDGGRNTMHYAATYEMIEYIEMFLKMGADVTMEDDDQMTPLMLAADWKSPASYPLLTNVDITDSKARERYFARAFLYGAKHGDRELTLHAWKDEYVDTIDEKSGDTPLLAAIRDGQMPTARMLIRKGANRNIKDKDGNSPLLLAAKQGLNLVIRVLAAADETPQLESGDKRENTPLILAVRARNEETVKTLLDLGADKEAMNAYGETALDIAEEMKLNKIIELLNDWTMVPTTKKT